MTSALYLLRALNDSQPTREIRLFEGFVSFKPKGATSSHCADVLALRAVVLDRSRRAATVIRPDEFVNDSSHRVLPAFAVAGMEFGIPPLIKTMANTAADGAPRRR